MDPRSPAALRAKLAEAGVKPALPKGISANAPTLGPPPIEPPKTDTSQEIAYQCGHKVGLKAFAHEACPHCRNKARQEKIAKKREQQEARRAMQEAQDAPRLGKTEQQHGRLPHDSTFHVVYDAEAQQWHGHLMTHGEIFKGSATGVEWLLRDLARQWRESQAGK